MKKKNEEKKKKYIERSPNPVREREREYIERTCAQSAGKWRGDLI